ncbi:hypothetical protein [Sagittula sp. S175]|uniref:hypothetical protein n=1 Tax=Sagittula sp. S175 TaxID=3415129 RepID=UPI003C7EDA2A
MATKKTTGPRRESSARDRRKASEEDADLARGANGLSEFHEAQQEALEGMMKVQMEAVNTMINATAQSWKMMTDFWTSTLPKGRKDD